MNARLLNSALAGVLLALVMPTAWTHEGHDHAAPAARASPARDVFLPLSGQGGLATRGVRAAAVSQHLPARVVADPRFSALVAAPLKGSLFAPASGFPRLGQRVSKGETLAWLRPSLSNADLSDIQADLAAAQRDEILFKRQIERFKETYGDISSMSHTPQYLKLRNDYAGAVSRIQAYQRGLTRRYALRAPLAGVVSSVAMEVGRVVAAGETLLEIVQPEHLWITALSYDTTLRPPARAYALTPDGQRVELELIGESRRLLGQALPLQYVVVQTQARLAVGQALTLHLSPPAQNRLPPRQKPHQP